jgi:MoxR-like ATPase
MTDSELQAMRGELEAFRADFLRLRDEVSKVIVGQRDILDDTLTALVAGGHVLLEGVPGLGKTLLVRTLADALHLKFQRIQFTPDLMPADLIGTNIVMETPDSPMKSIARRRRRNRRCSKRCKNIRSPLPGKRIG